MISQQVFENVMANLEKSNQDFSKHFPGDSSRGQPIHTVYGGAHLFRSDSARKLGDAALSTLRTYAPDFIAFARALELPGGDSPPSSAPERQALLVRAENDSDGFKKTNPGLWVWHQIYERVCHKLKREPVEDFRLDFEDGYGNRSDEEEDGHAKSAALEVATGLRADALPPFIGIRIKPFNEDLKRRSVRTLDIFLSALLRKTSNILPANFVVTLPKVQMSEQVSALVHLLEAIEKQSGLAAGALKFEIMIETPQAIIGQNGHVVAPALIAAARGRCTGAHFGVYDYTAARNIAAAHQNMGHPACDFAREIMCVSLAGTGVQLSDGATNILPVGPHKKAKSGPALNEAQLAENRETVHHAWRLAFADIEHSLKNGIYQGWDLHPAQLPIRYAATYAFFLHGLDAASQRLRSFVGKAAQASLSGDVFDDAATGQGLLNFFIRGINRGAISEDDALKTGLTLSELRSRSFLHILRQRRLKNDTAL